MSDMTENGWHLDKRVPLALIVALLLQTGGAAYYAAIVTSRVENNTRQIAEIIRRSEARNTFDNSVANRLISLEKDVQYGNRKLDELVEDVRQVRRGDVNR